MDINAIEQQLMKMCPQARAYQHPFYDITIPKELGGNGETVTYRKYTYPVGNVDHGRTASDWIIFLYPGQPSGDVSSADLEQYKKWKAEQAIRSSLKRKPQ